MTTPKNLPSRTGSRVFGLQDAPVFHPTAEEFADPIKYIAWLAAPEGGNAKNYGIAKIVPPEGWTPDFVLDQQKFRFRTRVQRLNSLNAEARATLNYHEQLQKFHSQQGSKRVSIPIIDRKPTDLYSLRRAVDAYGGFEMVSKARKWTEVTRKLGYPEKECAQLSAQVKAAYIKIIMPFEVFLAKAKEQGRTVKFSADPAQQGGLNMTVQSPAAARVAPKQDQAAASMSPESSVANGSDVQMSDASQAPQMNGVSEQQTSSAAPESTQTSQQTSPGAVHEASGPAPLDTVATTAAQPSSSTPAAASASASQLSSNNPTPSSTRIMLKLDGQARPAAAAAAALALANGAGADTPDGKSWSEELLAAGLTPEEIAQIEAEAAGKRRSSRRKTETAAQPAPSTPTASRKRKALDDANPTIVELLTTQGAEEQMCEICLRGDNGTSMLLCDDCNRGYHMFCLDPPLTTIPKSQWFCPPCLVGTGNDFGFDDGETHSLHSFWQRAELFRNSWWSIKKRNEEDSTMRAAMFGSAVDDKVPAQNGAGSETSAAAAVTAGPSANGALSPDGDTVMQDPIQDAQPTTTDERQDLSTVKAENEQFRGITRPIPGTSYTISEDEIEREYWRLVHSPQEAVEVEYGADIHSTTHGSALPTLETHPENPYSKDSWNLNNLPITSGSLLRYIKSDISGMTVPWIYVGMMFSTFCWHNEDHFTYSVNYQHWGETKTWYGVPGADAEKFEEAMRRVAPDLFETSPDLLFQLVTMMSPERLREQGVRVYAADQRPNEFVVTFPKAYHSGFNHGFNLNEAVNFALPDWIDTGLQSVQRYQQFHKFPVFSHDELLCTVLHHHLTVNSAVWLRKPIGDMVTRESEARIKIRQALPGLQERLEDFDRTEADYQCAHCNVFCYLSQVISTKGAKVACPEHAFEVLGEDDTSSWVLRLRFGDDYLSAMQTKVADRASQPSSWKNRFRKLLITSPRPSLKTLRTLLADGERITSLPELEQLRHFVGKANDWVERANTFISRRSLRGTQEHAYVRRADADPTVKDAERTPEYVQSLLEEVENLGFDSPEIAALHGILNNVAEFKHSVAEIFAAEASNNPLSISKCYAAQDLSDRTNIEMVERDRLDDYVARRRWVLQAQSYTDSQTSISIGDIRAAVEEAARIKVGDSDPLLVSLRHRLRLGDQWVARARALLAMQAPEPRITHEEIWELLNVDRRVPVDEDVRINLDIMRKKHNELSSTLESITGTQEERNQYYILHSRAEDPTPAINRAKMALQSIDKMHLAVPNTELVRMHVLRYESWNKRLEDAVLDAFSPFSTPSRHRLEEMMDALCKEIMHTADPWDHYPTDPPRRHCVCRTLHKPPEGHREVRKCSSCVTIYHIPCLKIEEEWDGPTRPISGDRWKCPICDMHKLPILLEHRQTLSLNAITPLVTEQAWNVSEFLFIPSRWFPLRQSLDHLDGLSTAIGGFLAKNPTPAVPDQAYMLWHSMRKVLACPVELVLPQGEPIVDALCDILFVHAGLREKGEKTKRSKSDRQAASLAASSSRKGSAVDASASGSKSQKPSDSSQQPKAPEARTSQDDTLPQQPDRTLPSEQIAQEARAPKTHAPPPQLTAQPASPSERSAPEMRTPSVHGPPPQLAASSPPQSAQEARTSSVHIRPPQPPMQPALSPGQMAREVREAPRAHGLASQLPGQPAQPHQLDEAQAQTVSTEAQPRNEVARTTGPMAYRGQGPAEESSTPKLPHPSFTSPMILPGTVSVTKSPAIPARSPMPPMPPIFEGTDNLRHHAAQLNMGAPEPRVPFPHIDASSPEMRLLPPERERLLGSSRASSELKTPDLARASVAGRPSAVPSHVPPSGSPAAHSSPAWPSTERSGSVNDEILNLNAHRQSERNDPSAERQGSVSNSTNLDDSLNSSGQLNRQKRDFRRADSSAHDFDDTFSEPEYPRPDAHGEYRVDPTGAPDALTLQAMPKKRGKRAKLVFEEEIEPTVPVNGLLAPCLCRQHREVEMISCDRCSNWYHLDCVVVTPYQAKTDKRWSCPFCCLKTERKYQYAEVKVKDSRCPPGVYVDVRATLRSTDDVIRKPQHWMLSNHRRIVLHLHQFVPAVAAGINSGKGSRDPNDRDGTVSRDGSPRDSVARDFEPQGGADASPSMDHQGHASSSVDPPPAAQAEASTSTLGPTARLAEERHRLGMQNLYARGVTDAMIAKWYIGWDGQKLVYPHYSHGGRIMELDLGPSIKLAADDPDGSKLIHARIRQRELEDERESASLPPHPSYGPPPHERGPPPILFRPERRRVHDPKPPGWSLMPPSLQAPHAMRARGHGPDDGPSNRSHHSEMALHARGPPPPPQAEMYRSHYDEAPYDWNYSRPSRAYDPYGDPRVAELSRGHYDSYAAGPSDYDHYGGREFDYRGRPYPGPQPSYRPPALQYPDPRAQRDHWPAHPAPQNWAPPRSSFSRRESSPPSYPRNRDGPGSGSQGSSSHSRRV